MKHGTYTDDNFIYSVDLMFMYVKTIKSKKINIKKLLPKLKIKDWDNYSPIQIIKNKNLSPNDYDRIIHSDLRYPIIINEKLDIIDGMHRLAKSYMKNKLTIRVYKIDKNIFNKFIVGEKSKKSKEWKDSDWDYYESLSEKDINDLFKKRFLLKI